MEPDACLRVTRRVLEQPAVAGPDIEDAAAPADVRLRGMLGPPVGHPWRVCRRQASQHGLRQLRGRAQASHSTQRFHVSPRSVVHPCQSDTDGLQDVLSSPHYAGEPSENRVRVGCATWAIGTANDHLLPRVSGGNLARYAARLPAAEINSSFHRRHLPATWGRWARSVGPTFRFSVKLPKSITHERRLVDVGEQLDAFAGEVAMLDAKLAVVLVQLPPSHSFDAGVFASFHTELAARVRAAVVVEPRHPSWFEDEVDAFLEEHRVARVAADPAIVLRAAEPGGWRGLRYFRLHGSPVTYRSSYDGPFLDSLAARLLPGDWCIFDNTASGAALPNAVGVLERRARSPRRSTPT